LSKYVAEQLKPDVVLGDGVMIVVFGFSGWVFEIVIDAFTPIPYKALTLGSGLMKFNPLLFALVSFPVRSIRYIIVANTASYIGDQLRQEFEKTFLMLVIIGIVFLTLFFYVKNKMFPPTERS